MYLHTDEQLQARKWLESLWFACLRGYSDVAILAFSVLSRVHDVVVVVVVVALVVVNLLFVCLFVDCLFVVNLLFVVKLLLIVCLFVDCFWCLSLWIVCVCFPIAFVCVLVLFVGFWCLLIVC